MQHGLAASPPITNVPIRPHAIFLRGGGLAVGAADPSGSPRLSARLGRQAATSCPCLARAQITKIPSAIISSDQNG
jgi:hypothetical protein